MSRTIDKIVSGSTLVASWEHSVTLDVGYWIEKYKQFTVRHSVYRSNGKFMKVKEYPVVIGGNYKGRDYSAYTISEARALNEMLDSGMPFHEAVRMLKEDEEPK